MEWIKLILTFLADIAWPALIGFIIYYFRQPLIEKLLGIKSIEGKDTKVYFDIMKRLGQEQPLPVSESQPYKTEENPFQLNASELAPDTLVVFYYLLKTVDSSIQKPSFEIALAPYLKKLKRFTYIITLCNFVDSLYLLIAFLRPNYKVQLSQEYQKAENLPPLFGDYITEELNKRIEGSHKQGENELFNSLTEQKKLIDAYFEED